MPELAEVAYYIKQWDPGMDKPVKEVHLHSQKRVFRGVDCGKLVKGLTGASLRERRQNGKQMLFKFTGGAWLGVHLGMTGKLRSVPRSDYIPEKHDHLVLRQAGLSLLFNDFRLFGRIRYDETDDPDEPPDWWQQLPPEIVDDNWDRTFLSKFLKRHVQAPLKSVLLDQEGFPGVGNWMADEILWRAKLHPEMRPGQLNREQEKRLFEACKWVCREAIATIGEDYRDPPEDWLFRHRWRDGGKCPATGKALRSKKVGGRRTVWSPPRQRLPRK
jgi:formamidopyrimidine-DNA glycosylase